MAGPFVRSRLRKEWKRLELRMALVEAPRPGPELDEELHEARKAAKRLRYALEVGELLWSTKPKPLRKRVHRLSDVLGEHQDTVVTRAALLELAARSDAGSPESTVLTRLHGAEQGRAAELLVDLGPAWEAAVTARSSWP